MGKSKKEKSPVINNIKNLNLEIDYDKLAKAIVKAQQETEKPQNEENTPKLSFCDTLKLIWLVICNKAESNGTMTSGVISFVLSLIFNVFAIFCVIITGCGIYVCIKVIKEVVWNLDTVLSSIAVIACYISFILIALTIAFVFRCIANEIEKEKDRNYIVAVFSGVVSFAALVVALIALLKGIL